MKRFKDFLDDEDNESDYRKKDGKREKKTSWKDASRKKRENRYNDDEHEDYND